MIKFFRLILLFKSIPYIKNGKIIETVLEKIKINPYRLNEEYTYASSLPKGPIPELIITIPLLSPPTH